jgi:hypothetical protein
MNHGAVVPQETAVLPLPLAELPRRAKGKGKREPGGTTAEEGRYCR